MKLMSFITIVFILLAEVLSFLSFAAPVLNLWIFAFVALAALVLTVWKLEWGVYLIFAELAIGSFGKLFVLQIGGVEISIRLVLWLVVLSCWVARILAHRAPHPSPLPKGEGAKSRVAFLHSQFFKPYLALAIVLGWGIVWGLGRSHDFGAVFFDVNNYLYFLLIFPVYDVLSQNRNAMNRVFTIIAAAISWLSIKTIILFYIFSHELFGLQDILYDWSRHLQLAEITVISPFALTSRIFMQSQIWVLFGLFVALGVILSEASRRRAESKDPVAYPRTSSMRSLDSLRSLGMTVLMSTALVMSFSRSFWLAGILSLGIFLISLLARRERFIRVFYFGILSIAIVALGVGLTLGVAAFPVPRGAPGGSSILKERVEKFKEAAASSRMSQIRPLLTAIAKHPAIGSGFGQAVTYQSQDPRVVKSHPNGSYTTTAFELGWLEMWLKIGLAGVLIYLYLLWRILKAGWHLARHPEPPYAKASGGKLDSGVDLSPEASAKGEGSHGLPMGHYIVLGSLAGLIAIVITHGVSPYLNHPLGIGVVLLLTCVFDTRQRQE